MMFVGNFVKMVAANTMRSLHFVLSAFGIVIGIATARRVPRIHRASLQGARKIFLLEQVRSSPGAPLLGKDISKKLDDNIVRTILARPEVAGDLRA